MKIGKEKYRLRCVIYFGWCFLQSCKKVDFFQRSSCILLFSFFTNSATLGFIHWIRKRGRDPQWARKFKKIPVQKNSWNQINQFHEKSFDQIPFFAISEMAKIQFLICGKSLKLSKCNFTNIFMHLFDFKRFFCLDFFKVSGPLCSKR